MLENKNCRTLLLGLAIALGAGGLGGCAAVHTSIAKKDLDVQTKMSDTVFLDPVSPDKRVVYVQIRNTSDKSNFDVEQPIKAAIANRGYRVTYNPDEAHYWLQANVLSVAKTDPTAAESALHAGYGGPLAGAAMGAAIGGGVGGWHGAGVGGLAGAFVGAAVETVANASVKDVTFMVVTDIEISEKVKEGVVVREDTQLSRKQGRSGSSKQTSSEVVDRKKYRTRIVSTANKVNLEYPEAAQPLTDGVVRAVSGMF
jgi:hypothetical protein